MPDYPTRPDAYPIVYLEETDQQLPQRPDNRLRYVYFKTIARGGSCLIQSCKDLHLQRTICYKSLRPELADDPIEQRRFLREARVTAMLQHPNTIPTYEFGRDVKGHYYFTMKLVHGQTLREILEQCIAKDSHNATNGGFTHLIHVLEQACHALFYAHQHGVVHRDMKPENILIGPFNEVLVLDWGMAKAWSSSDPTHSAQEVPKSLLDRKRGLSENDPLLTIASPLHGSPPYVSPEQLMRRNDVDHRTDIYSLGAVLYEILTLQRMVPGETVRDVLDEIRNGSVASPISRNPSLDIPQELNDVCMKCVEHDPNDRYQSMKDVISTLSHWLHVLPEGSFSS